MVSLNPLPSRRAGQGASASYRLRHPVFDAAAIDAQRRLPQLQGRAHTWFCGAWTRYGFHEDGLMSGLAVGATRLRERLQRRRAGAARRRRDGASQRAPLIGTGVVRHRAAAAGATTRFAYRTYFLMLPMRRLREQPVRRAGAQPLRPARLPRPRPRRRPRRRLAWLDELLRARRHRRRRRRGLAADLPARAGLCLQAGQLLVLPPRRRLAGGDRGRGQQHLRRAPLLPAGRPSAGLRARAAARARCSTSRRSATSTAATASASCAAPRPTASAAWRASTTTTPTARCCRPACRGALAPLTRGQRCAPPSSACR